MNFVPLGIWPDMGIKLFPIFYFLFTINPDGVGHGHCIKPVQVFYSWNFAIYLRVVCLH